MSRSENIDPVEEMMGSSESPEEPQVPRKTRYGRIIVPKGDLPGEDLVPKIRKKKVQPVEPIKPKRKYTKRKVRTTESKDKEEISAVNEQTEGEVRKTIKEEEPEPDERGAWDSDGEEFNSRVAQPSSSGKSAESRVNFNEIKGGDELTEEPCELCGVVMKRYEMERHKLDNHPEHAPYECLSCRIRSFFSYWELKEHYILCSNNRIGCEDNSAELYSTVIEAAFFRRLYQPVECPFCKIYLATFFDLDVHFNSHGLATMDTKFACDGCRVTFVSVDALKKHLTQKNTPNQSIRCFNTGRVLNRREIEKMEGKFSDADRKDCLRKFNCETYVLSAPKILECAQEAICAFCDKTTRAYAYLKTDLSNLVNYGLECNEKTKEEIIQKIQHSNKSTNGRVPICRHHFQWRNWTRKEDEQEMTAGSAVQMNQLAQKVISRRKEQTASQMPIQESGARMAVERDLRRVIGRTASSHNAGHRHSIKQPRVMQLDDDKEDEVQLKKREVKMEEEDWDEGHRGDYDIVDISDDEVAQGGSGAADLPLFMEHDELEEKVSASMRIAYPCPVCESSYPTLQDLHEHQDVHPETRLQYLCADCPGKTYPCPDDVYKHFDEKKTSPVAALYSYKVIVQAEGQSDHN